MSEDKRLEAVKAALKAYPDFPKPGILFQDIFGVFSNPTALEALFSLLKDVATSLQNQIDIIVGLDSRGFLLGPHMAHAIGKPFVPIRKKGKLPGSCHSVEYKLEYGTDTFQIQQESVKKGDKVFIVDDLLATGGTMSAAVHLIQKCQGDVVQCWVLMELMDLKGRDKVEATVESLIKV